MATSVKDQQIVLDAIDFALGEKFKAGQVAMRERAACFATTHDDTGLDSGIRALGIEEPPIDSAA